MRRVGGAYFNGLPHQRNKAHLYADCGMIKENLIEAPLYQDSEGRLLVYTTLNVKGEPFSHKNTELGPRTVPVKRCVHCVNRERRDDARITRSRR